MSYKLKIVTTMDPMTSHWSTGNCRLVSDILLIFMAAVQWRMYPLYLNSEGATLHCIVLDIGDTYVLLVRGDNSVCFGCQGQ